MFTGGLMLLGGRLADMVGRRAVFLAGLTVFTAASLASGLAWEPSALIASRAVQGVGAAMLLPSALSILTTTYEGHQRAVALAVWGALGAAGAAAGVLFGGLLTTLLSWEWIFFINVPVGIVAGVFAFKVIAGGRSKTSRGGLDLAGAGTLMGGLVTLVLAVEGTATHGWTSTRTVVMSSVSVALLTAFAAIEHHVRQPLVPTGVWRTRSLVSGASVMFVATGIMVGAFFLNTLYMQRVLGWSPLETGLAFLPMTLVVLVAAHVASHLMPAIGTRPLMTAGLSIVAVGALLLSQASAHASYVPDVLPGLLALGFGIGLSFVSVSVAAMSDVAEDVAGLASGMMTTAHELGAAIGVAVLAAIATSGASSASAASLMNGYGSAFISAGAVAAAMAVFAAAVVPSVRPAPGSSHGMH